MVSIFGNDIISAYTNGVSVKAIFNNGVQVWPSGSGTWYYYIQWTPTDITGSFHIGSSYYRFEDYPNGIFSSFDGIITEGAFSGTSITTLSTNARTIETNAFMDCWSLNDIYAECLIISSYAFYNIPGEYITLPYCQYIGSSAFYYNYTGGNSQKYVTLGCDNTVVAVGANAFRAQCIYNLNVPAWLNNSWTSDLVYKSTQWAGYMTGYPQVLNISVFHNVSCPGYYSNFISWGVLESSDFSYATEIDSVTTNATGVGSSCFLNSTSLVEIYLPHCLTIDTYAFKGCTSLQTVVGSNISYVRSHAFEGCTSLSIINLSTCYTIDSYAFSGCTNLNTIRVGYPPMCQLSGSNVFKNCDNLEYIYVPRDKVSNYKAASGWSYFADIIYPIP